MKDELKKPEYKDIKLVKVAYGDDDDQKSFQETQGLLQAYPNLKGIISPTTVGIAAAARYLSDLEVQGQGQADRSRHAEPDAQVRQGRHGRRVPAVGTREVGYLAGYAAAALVAGHITGKEGEKFKAGGSASTRSAPTARSCSARRPPSPRTTSTSSISRNDMTATDSTRPPAAADPRPGPRARVGVFGIGLATYWPQFEGLRERVEGYQRRVEQRVRAWARRWSRPAWSTRRRAPARPVSASRPSAWTWCSATP